MAEEENKAVGWIKSFLARTDFMQVLAFVLLIAAGVMFIYGTGQQIGGELASTFWIRQLQWVVFGVLCWLFLGMINYRYCRNLSWIFYLLSLILLVLVLVAGVKVYGAKRWLQLGPMRIQPSEFAKLATLLTVAQVMSLPGFDINKLKDFLKIMVIVGIPFLLIVVEPDLGTGLILVPMTVIMIFIAGLRWRYIVIGGTVVISLLALEGVNEYYQIKPLLKGYQRDRIAVFIHPEKDPQYRGWNQFQAKLAIGSGGVSGKGFMQGTQNELGFLPQTVSHTDFIFSVIAEETGFTGAALLICCYGLLVFSMLRTAVLAADKFGQYLAAGAAGVIFMHTFVNMGMNVGVLPVTGVPLPLVSYGGSFLLTIMIYLGLIQSIYARRRVFSSTEEPL